MKNFVTMLKIFAMSLVVAAIVFPAMTCGAGQYPRPITDLDEVVGNWYDSKGNLVLTISSDYNINGCKVMAVYANNDYQPLFFGSATLMCKINEGNRYRNLNLDINSDRSGFHPVIILDGKIGLRNTKNPRYFESVGGIYLGMGKEQLLALYGQPSRQENNYGHITWFYDKEGFDIRFFGDIVGEIVIYRTGDRRFDRSGLSAWDSETTFRNHYSGKNGQRSGYRIGYNEQLFFGRRVALGFDEFP